MSNFKPVPAAQNEVRTATLACIAASSAMLLSACAEPYAPTASNVAPASEQAVLADADFQFDFALTLSSELPRALRADIAKQETANEERISEAGALVASTAEPPMPSGTSISDTSDSPEPPGAPPEPRNFTGVGFIGDGESVAIGNAVSISIAALDDELVTGYFVAESTGETAPPTPASDDPNWVEIEPAAAYAATHTYTLQLAAADGTSMNLHVWFKDNAGNVSSPSTGQVAVLRSDRVVTATAPYLADTALGGFEGWGMHRDNADAENPIRGRAKAGASNTNNDMTSPPLVLPSVSEHEEILLQLSQWYLFDADANVFDGARARVQISTEQSPGVWSEWAELSDADADLSAESTSPQLDLTPYAGATIRLRVGVAGNLRPLLDWGLTSIRVNVAQPIEVSPHTTYAHTFESGWERWSTSTPNWSIDGPGLDGLALASEGLYHAAARPNGAESSDFVLRSPAMQLPGDGPIDVSFSERHALHYGEGRLQISYYDPTTGWSGWIDLIRPITGRITGWQTVQASISDYAGMRVRLQLLARLSPGDEAWFVDEFSIIAP